MAIETLSEAPGRQLRMTDLAIACGVSGSGITRIVNRLDREGLTRRVLSPRDARGAVAVLTESGQASLERTRPAHLASVRRHFLDQIDEADLARFASSMKRIADSRLTGNGAPGGRRARTTS
jgi:DNA-binding MarR family transcriptional regulator